MSRCMQMGDLSSMSFESAVAVMVAIHKAEVKEWQTQAAASRRHADNTHAEDSWCVPSSEANHHGPQRVLAGQILRPSTPREPVGLTPKGSARHLHVCQGKLAQTTDHREPISNHQEDTLIKRQNAAPGGPSSMRSPPAKLEVHDLKSLESIHTAENQASTKDSVGVGERELTESSSNAGEALALDRLQTSRRDSNFVMHTSSVESLKRHMPVGMHASVVCADDKSIRAFTFGDSALIRDEVRKNRLLKPEYNVKDRYQEKGFFQFIARHYLFEYVTMAVISVNAIWIALSTDIQGGDATQVELQFIMPDIPFLLYFVLEVFIRLMALSDKLRFWRDRWFVFDAALVVLYFIDPFALSLIGTLAGGAKLNLPTELIRLCRLARLFRLNRLLRLFPQLMILVRGMLTAMASVSYTILLLGIGTFVFAVSIRVLVPDRSTIEQKYFPSVPETMHHLIIHGNFMDSMAEFIHPIQADSVPCFILVWMYVVMAAVLTMNMLIGILCEVISSVAMKEKEAMLIDRAETLFRDLLLKFDENKNGQLSWAEFAQMVSDEECQQALRRCGVDLGSLVDVAEDLYFDAAGADTKAMSYAEFISMLLDSRGSATATVRDVLAIGSRFNRKSLELKKRLEVIAANIEFLVTDHRRSSRLQTEPIIG